MRCACCNTKLEESEVRYNKLLKRWDYCGVCKTASREIIAEYEWLENNLESNNFLLDNQFIPEYNIGVEEDDT
jgi:hypothetical protein|tara:strand:- start:2653 stop:2871 length:219 start_codon:yes stop_codon:yes gene_type:complete